MFHIAIPLYDGYGHRVPDGLRLSLILICSARIRGSEWRALLYAGQIDLFRRDEDPYEADIQILTGPQIVLKRAPAASTVPHCQLALSWEVRLSAATYSGRLIVFGYVHISPSLDTNGMLKLTNRKITTIEEECPNV